MDMKHANTMKWVSVVLRVLIVVIGVYMVIKFPRMSAPCMSGIAFICIGIHLCFLSMYGTKLSPCHGKKCCGGGKSK